LNINNAVSASDCTYVSPNAGINEKLERVSNDIDVAQFGILHRNYLKGAEESNEKIPHVHAYFEQVIS
jgi:hypothetical protein